MLYHEPASGRSWRYVYPGGSRPWVAGNSLCYTKASWARAPFADVSVGEDARFIWGVPARRPFVMPDASLLVAMVHGGNVDAKRLGHPCFRPLPTEEIRSVMGGDFDEWRTLELGRGRLSG